MPEQVVIPYIKHVSSYIGSTVLLLIKEPCSSISYFSAVNEKAIVFLYERMQLCNLNRDRHEIQVIQDIMTNLTLKLYSFCAGVITDFCISITYENL